MFWGPFYVKLSFFLGIYTGTLSCTVKLPDEVCASHTKRVGNNKKIYNSRSSQSAAHWFILLNLFLKYSAFSLRKSVGVLRFMLNTVRL